jgi:N-acetylmuramic acid 6-phosphate etherase
MEITATGSLRTTQPTYARESMHDPVFEQFQREYALTGISTEAPSEITLNLSQIMQSNICDGLDLLLKVDENVGIGYERSLPLIRELSLKITEKLKAGGHIYFIASGSSGRVGIDIAAKCVRAFPEMKDRIHARMAGDDSTFIRAKEGFEDSEKSGLADLEDAELDPNDVVFITSASAQSKHSVGCATYAANRGSSVYYFFNTTTIPERVSALFSRADGLITPISIDIGGQAISGSTRLQAATLAEIFFAGLIGSSIFRFLDDIKASEEYPITLLEGFRRVLLKVREHFPEIARIIETEKEVFCHPNSNFYTPVACYPRGCVTYLAMSNSASETVINNVEMAPTFSVTPTERESETSLKPAPYRSYIVDIETHREGAEVLLARPVRESAEKDIAEFALAAHSKEGIYTFEKRPHAKGSAVIGVTKLEDGESYPTSLLALLKAARDAEALTNLIVLCKGTPLLDPSMEELPPHLVMRDVPHDPLGVLETLTLKLTLNAISNGTMVCLNKVLFNRMIDVKAANNKLIARAMGLIQELWPLISLKDFPISTDALFYMIKEVYTLMGTHSINTPSIVKIILTLLAKEKESESFFEAVKDLQDQNESLNWLIVR